MPIRSGMDALKKTDTFLVRTRLPHVRTCVSACFITFLAGLVVFAERLNPIPSRTRPLNFPAPMVLSLKAWKSRSLPGLPRTLASPRHDDRFQNGRQQWRPFFIASVDARGCVAAYRELRADHSAAMRRRNAFGFSANRRPGKPLRRFQMRAAARRDQRRQARSPGRERLMRRGEVRRAPRDPGRNRADCAGAALPPPILFRAAAKAVRPDPSGGGARPRAGADRAGARPRHRTSYQAPVGARADRSTSVRR